MISVFPTPCPDELLCSVGGRYADLRHLNSNYAVVESMFGSPPPKVNVFFPTGLDALVKRIPRGHSYTAKLFTSKNSMLPYHRPFLPIERVAQIETQMEQRTSEPAFVHSSSVACRIEQAHEFMYCPDCVLEERRKLHFCYFHRVHHAPGVFVCPEHKVWLESTGIPTKARYAFVTAEDVIPTTLRRPLDKDNQIQEDLLVIAQNSMWLLENDVAAGSYEQLRLKYIELLSKKGLASRTGHVFSQKLIQAFSGRFSSEFLNMFDSQLETQHHRNWLARIVQAKQIQHPIRHLLLMCFLGVSAKELFELQLFPHPFGEGPWNCLNPICPHHLQPVIAEIMLGVSRNGRRRTMGTFMCPTCGYVYCQTEPINPSSGFPAPKVIAYGPPVGK